MVGLEVSGHSGFAEAGSDIVCAAVSALVLSAVQGLRTYCNVEAAVIDAPTSYRLRVPAGGDERAQAVLETAIGGLQAIAASYPRHVLVEDIAQSKRSARTGQASRPKKSAVRTH
ncbi:MAG: ribosomal-processing cysteine protease Prp [Candidatus Eremiobacteraeota bacterium]|nr:ribosomal-processing cysteine protease Prp [Candidatus Eremiobacteraeota bacterium]